MAFQFIRSETVEGVLVLTMDDPKTRNALGQQMAAELMGEIDRCDSDPELRVLVITGADPAFNSGANVRDFDRSIQEKEEKPPQGSPSPWEQLDPSYFAAHGRQQNDPEMGIVRVVLRLFNLHKPTIAAVNGYAYGIGHGIALSCDFRIASEKAVFCEAFIKRGLIAGDGSCWQLPKLIGISNALLMQFTGEPVEAEAALQMGLCNKVVPHQELMNATLELATTLAQGPTYAMALMKMLARKAYSQDFPEHLREAARAQTLARATQDHKEGVRAFIEKRKPRFVGR